MPTGAGEIDSMSFGRSVFHEIRGVVGAHGRAGMTKRETSGVPVGNRNAGRGTRTQRTTGQKGANCSSLTANVPAGAGLRGERRGVLAGRWPFGGVALDRAAA